jgi:hypothetical protein
MCVMWVPIGDHLRENRNDRARRECAPKIWPVIAIYLRAAMTKAARIAKEAFRPPLIPAKAGIQFLRKDGSPPSRGRAVNFCIPDAMQRKSRARAWRSGASLIRDPA